MKYKRVESIEMNKMIPSNSKIVIQLRTMNKNDLYYYVPYEYEIIRRTRK